MAIITGLRLSELQKVSLATTGTLFYISAANDSFSITETALYNTLDKFHISGSYQPKNEDWRFIHRTGNQDVTGILNASTFGSINPGLGYSLDTTNGYIKDVSGNTSIVIDRVLLGLNGDNLSLNWGERKLYNQSSQVTLDWDNKILTGNWVAQNLSITGTQNHLVHTTGSENILGSKKFNNSLFANIIRNTGNPLIGLDLTTGNLNDRLSLVSLNWQDRILLDSLGNTVANWNNRILNSNSATTTIDWNNRVLSGSWNVNSMTINNQNIVTGNNVVYTTGNQTINGDKTFQNTVIVINDLSINNTDNNKITNQNNDFNMDLDDGTINLSLIDGSTSVDFANKILSGQWTVNQLQSLKLVLTGISPTAYNSVGISGQIATKDNFIYIATGTNLWGRTTLLPWP